MTKPPTEETTMAPRNNSKTKPEAKPATTKSAANASGIILAGKPWVVDLDELDADTLRDCVAITGRSEMQILNDTGTTPGRLALTNFVWLASRCAGEPLTIDEAFALVTPTVMTEGRPMTDAEVDAEVARIEARPQA
jgi:hypothetical protein